MEGINTGQKVFLIGIGGIGMSAIAVILKERGFSVSGSDRAESTTTNILKKQGIEVLIGHKSEHITRDTGIVVYTNAVNEENPEMAKARELGITVYERAKMLDILASTKYAIGVSGTHGKTTTTSMVAKMFLNAGFEPSLAVGGFLNEINGSGHEGKGKYFIYESCEAYESFLRLHPNVALITNIDADHLDYYKSFSNVKKAFSRYIRENIPPYGVLVYNMDDRPLRKVVRGVKLERVVSVGIRRKNADYVARDVFLDDFSSTFTVLHRGKPFGKFRVNIPGMHNVTNALLALAAAHINGIPAEVIAVSLAHFRNADRRFQLKFSASNLMVIDDYAHHPAEIDATLLAAKNLSVRKGAQVIAVFQPHLYSRTEFLYKDFAKSLSKADRVVLTDIYAARETNVNNVSSRMIFDEIVRIMGAGNVAYSKDLSGVPEKIRSFMNGNNIVITLGAGDVWKVSDMFGSDH
jgi:UDP-N-acetylmuramate--alanine ligase